MTTQDHARFSCFSNSHTKTTTRLQLAMLGLCLSAAATVVNASPSSDDFNACDLKPFWTVEDPVGGASVQVVGTGTADALLKIAVPAGASHDAWIPNDTVRVMQPADNIDFQIQTKMQSTFTAGYQMQGLLVEQAAGIYLRYDVVCAGSTTFLYAATFNGTTATERLAKTVSYASPFWLSLQRAGNQWTAQYSTNGQNWQTAGSFSWTATVSKAGVFAGNYSPKSAPAFTAYFDFFLNTADPLAAEDDPLTGGVTLTTSVVGQGTIEVDPVRTNYACGETLTVTAVPDSGWQFDGWSGDLTGTESPTTLTMNGPTNIVATFVPEGSTNTAPVADDQAVTVTEGLARTITLTAADPDGPSPLTFAILTPPTNGTLGVLDATTGMVTYTSNAGAAADSFTFTATDGLGAVSLPATVSLSIMGSQPIASDDFNTCSLKPFWNLVDPVGGAVVRTTGTGTDDALLEIDVPAGTSHEPWINNESVRVLQPANNGDLQIQAKFQSTFDAGMQLQGLIVEENAGTYLRCEIFFDGSSTFLYAASFTPTGTVQYLYQPVTNVSPFWLGLSRTGDQWTMLYSIDGAAWNSVGTFEWIATVTQVGVYAGNYSTTSAPAFTAKIDYFLNTADALPAEDGPASGAFTLTTNVVGQGSIVVDPTRTTYACGEVVTVTAVPSPGWDFAGWSGDLTGTQSPTILTMDQSRTITATFTAASSPNQSDDFNTCALSPFWTVVDPVGGANVHLTGTGTADALLEIAVPAGASHDAWIPNEGVRVMQPAENNDFHIQTKLQSTFTAGYQMQGLLVEQDAGTYLRYDLVHDGSNTYIYATTISGTNATQRLNTKVTYTNPFWLSVQRVGNQWTLNYSPNGQTWQKVATFAWSAAVSKVGVYAGNYAPKSAPAFTAKFDYFLNTADPMTTEDGPLTCP